MPETIFVESCDLDKKHTQKTYTRATWKILVCITIYVIWKGLYCELTWRVLVLALTCSPERIYIFF